jgi:hypothetical protein
METKESKVGTFEVESGQLVVSDPCYSYRGPDWPNADLQSVLGNVRNGTWRTVKKTSIFFDEPVGRVVSVKCFLQGVGDGLLNPARAELFNNNLAVDSGQMSIVDSICYPSFVGKDHGEWGDADSGYYQAYLCHEDKGAGVIQGGAVCSSGFGDGGYSGYLYRDAEGKVVGVEVVFITEENEEEDEAYS